MKKIRIAIVLTCFTLNAFAQNTLTVGLENNKYTIPEKADDFFYTLPLSMNFPVSIFKDKTIAFYTAADDATKVVGAKFGDDISPKQGTTNYVVKVGSDLKLDIGDSPPELTGRTLYFKIDGSEFSKAIRFSKEKGEPGPGYKLGSPVKDAIQISEIINKQENTQQEEDLLNDILKYYGVNKGNMAENKFLASELGDVGNIHSKEEDKTTLLSSALSTVGGLDVTKIVDGLARFMVKRTKEELSITFFQKFNEELDTYPDLGTVFPNTRHLLAAMGDEVYNYSNYISNLREAFRADLQSLDEHLPGIIDNHKDIFSKEGNFILAAALRSGCYVSLSLRHDMHPGDILEAYPTNFLDGAKASEAILMKRLKGSVQALQLFSELLKENETSGGYWVSMDQIRQAVNNKQTLKILIGLSLQIAHDKYDKVRFSEKDNLYDQLNNDSVVGVFDTDYLAYRQYFISFGSKITELNRMIREYDPSVSDSLRVEQYAKFFRLTMQFMEHCVQATTLPHIKNIPGLDTLSDATEIYFDIAYEVTDLGTAINRKRYSEAINHALVIYSKVVKDPQQVLIVAAGENVKGKSKPKQVARKPEEAAKNDPQQDVASFVYNDETLRNSLNERVVAAMAALANYGAFMSQMVAAANSKEIAEAIESAAMPTGSARVKRETKLNVAVNAYSGLFIGREVIRGYELDEKNSELNTFGVTAPIGISVSKGHRILPFPLSEIWKTKNAGWSSTWFLSLIDIGAITAFRFKNDSTEQIPTVQLKDIFSPGIFYSLGIPNTPVSINAGMQVGPNLRKVKGTNEYSDRLYFRYSVSVCVDIPLLNLHSRSR